MLWSVVILSLVYSVTSDLASPLSPATHVRRDFSVFSHNKKVVCYWGTWANYRPAMGKFTPENIDPTLCTHLIYSFAGLNSSTWAMKSLDPWMDLEDDYGLAGFRKATDLKSTHPHLKVTLAIGGWNEGSQNYSIMARDPNKRKVFAASALSFIRRHNFDGLDLDWEYPGKRGGVKEDKKNFILLIKDLYKVFRPQNLMLTAAIGASAATIDAAYDIPEMYKYLDYVHVMCYDYHGKWDKKTGHNAPLKSRPDDSSEDQILNVDYTIQYLLQLGAVPHKTVLGVPLYGRAFTLVDPTNNKMGAPAEETSFQGPFTREDGFLGYNEICLKLTQETDWTVEWDSHYQAPFMYSADRWISFDDQRSIAVKSDYAFDQGLAGVMTWSIDTDDFMGMCNGAKFPLLRTINHALHNKQNGVVDIIYSSSSPVKVSASLVMVMLMARMFC